MKTWKVRKPGETDWILWQGTDEHAALWRKMGLEVVEYTE